MTKDRQIVLMLILRMRRARRLWLMWRKRSEDGDVFACDMTNDKFGAYIEAANAAELARRILYGHEL